MVIFYGSKITVQHRLTKYEGIKKKCMHKIFRAVAPFRHTDIKDQHMNLNNGDNQ